MMENLRINRIVELSGHHDTVADIGTDHGFTSLLLLRTGRATKVIATDISSDSLSKARRLFEQEGVQDLTECRTGDGLDVLEAGEADACIISGMGGHLIMKMLERDMDKVRAMDRLVLSPQSNIPEFRQGLMRNGLHVSVETAVFENDHFYTVFVAHGHGEPVVYTEEELLTGKSGLIYDRKGYEGYISHLVEKNRRMLSYSLSSKRRMELERENSILENFKHLLNGEQI
ncbi:MAG: SAM-dependent methyltransferase [Clostridia bacterium]|nr:SAM-dependent methyltransferase [Clostridia bacterium]